MAPLASTSTKSSSDGARTALPGLMEMLVMLSSAELLAAGCGEVAYADPAELDHPGCSLTATRAARLPAYPRVEHSVDVPGAFAVFDPAWGHPDSGVVRTSFDRRC